MQISSGTEVTIITFQVSCEAEMSSGRSQLVLPLKRGKTFPEPLTNDEFLRILQLIQTRDTAVIAEGLLSIKAIAEQLETKMCVCSPALRHSGSQEPPTSPLSLTVSTSLISLNHSFNQHH